MSLVEKIARVLKRREILRRADGALTLERISPFHFIEPSFVRTGADRQFAANGYAIARNRGLAVDCLYPYSGCVQGTPRSHVRRP